MTAFEQLKSKQEDTGTSKWGPFGCKADWALAKWVLASGASSVYRSGQVRLFAQNLDNCDRDQSLNDP